MARFGPAWLICAGMLSSQLGVAGAAEPALGTPVSTSPAVATPQAITLGQAVAAALHGNPGLRGFQFERQAQRARRDAAGLGPAPELGLELENFLGTGEYRGADALEATLALSQVLELGGKRQARIDAAEAGLSLAEVERQAAELDVLAEVARRFIDAATWQERLGLARRGVVLAEEGVTAAQRRIRAGRSPDVELLGAQVTLDRARLGEQRAVAELNSAYRLLAATWGSAEPVIDGVPFRSVQARLLELPPVPGYGDLARRLEDSPDFLRFASEARLRDAERRLAVSRRKPDLTLGGGLRRWQETRDEALVAFISVPVFAARQAEPLVAEAEASRALVDIRRESALAVARAALYQLHQSLAVAVAEVQALKQDILPRAEQALRGTEYAHERGRYGYLELADAQSSYLDLQLELIDAAADAHRVRVEIERLSNAPLVLQPIQ